MVLRLFVPPGEGQHGLVPKRPEGIGANATPQTCLVSSTLLAAVYTSFASTFNQRVAAVGVAPQQAAHTSRPALFVRSSARLGLCVGLAGAAVNWYYYSAFANVVVADKVQETSRWRLYQWTKGYTVDDGALAGAAIGLSASIPMLLMRRPATLPRWTRCLGMANIGGCTGVVGSHAYLQYTGERQKAYRLLEARRKRRSLEFWAIFWDKELMAKLSPIMQQYVRHNGVWYTQLLPDNAFEQTEDEVESVETTAAAQTTQQVANPEPVAQTPDPPFYLEPVDYTADLAQINVESTLARIQEMQVERQILLEEAHYLLSLNAHQRYEYCHLHKTLDADDRLRRLQEIHLVDVAHTRLRNAADALDMKIIHWHMSLQHKAAWENSLSSPSSSSSSSSSSLSTSEAENWLPSSHLINYATHRPSFSILEIEKMARQIDAQVQRFEEGSLDQRFPREKRERWRKDAEDGRVLLRAADHILFRMEKASSRGLDDGGEGGLLQQSGREEVMVATAAAAQDDATSSEGLHPANDPPSSTDDGSAADEMRLRKDVEQSRADAKKAAKPRRDGLGQNNP
ncbi:hypothetical protein COCMIDRAFT_85199 [Bipolaris oryzae ATCC 44560]|uniref:Uncharacterized protein n=1 Tax=Bipolaris oryzae ATCC 44560 TaxID=930090 RepID=W6ZZU8_COCMI|nr:uncharacterized protein COCMIDRAFT_85199 [Bipolaris oryzae ATCC 44560]EUC49246.1 hypothetical protein COCMIDRAFT_85199 [Bipolaris oryzae ATCC 44560]